MSHHKFFSRGFAIGTVLLVIVLMASTMMAFSALRGDQTSMVMDDKYRSLAGVVRAQASDIQRIYLRVHDGMPEPEKSDPTANIRVCIPNAGCTCSPPAQPCVFGSTGGALIQPTLRRDIFADSVSDTSYFTDPWRVAKIQVPIGRHTAEGETTDWAIMLYLRAPVRQEVCEKINFYAARGRTYPTVAPQYFTDLIAGSQVLDMAQSADFCIPVNTSPPAGRYVLIIGSHP
ncbi:MAG: hypothetical protein AB7G80_02485 [Dongiaceae bacterium]